MVVAVDAVYPAVVAFCGVYWVGDVVDGIVVWGVVAEKGVGVEANDGFGDDFVRGILVAFSDDGDI
ncbi:hypothetical protein KSX_06480 [Ktedonospora formicarum]|uniref:Uncharacterized protein n=1 Tax=Ktedonospora formicarum TaxID=2778364 RepID=A0A8J3MRP7_9CHLR|nr:hypothetical protein KSX_06480 [Ktedonospora formicarum]